MIFDMLKRLRSVVYLPNDYVCKKVRGLRRPQPRGLGLAARRLPGSGLEGALQTLALAELFLALFPPNVKKKIELVSNLKNGRLYMKIQISGWKQIIH